MKIEVRNESVIIEGYVNAVERASKPLYSRFGRFIEKICVGAFGRAITRNNNVRILLNHNWDKDLGGTGTGELELQEDNIGLHARAVITDAETVKDAKAGNLVGWSFGFRDIDVEEIRDNETGLPFRCVRDLELLEVSLLNKAKTPAYNGTLVNVRDGETVLLGEENKPEKIEIELLDETTKEAIEEIRESAESEIETEPAAETKAAEVTATNDNIKSFDNSRYINIVSELKKCKVL